MVCLPDRERNIITGMTPVMMNATKVMIVMMTDTRIQKAGETGTMSATN